LDSIYEILEVATLLGAFAAFIAAIAVMMWSVDDPKDIETQEEKRAGKKYTAFFLAFALLCGITTFLLRNIVEEPVRLWSLAVVTGLVGSLGVYVVVQRRALNNAPITESERHIAVIYLWCVQVLLTVSCVGFALSAWSDFFVVRLLSLTVMMLTLMLQELGKRHRLRIRRAESGNHSITHGEGIV
jgi:hypothetical protein